jgi:hypothetical protein
MSKQLVNFITCGCKSSAPFFVNYKAGRVDEGIIKGGNILPENKAYGDKQQVNY